MDSLLTPLRVAASRPARRAYITTFLLLSSSLFLLFLAASAYILFYLNHIPRIGTLSPIHLQYTPDHPPTGTLVLPPSSIIPHQPYTITVHLRLPSSPANIAVGNFMLDLTLTSARGAVLARSRRPGIMTYRSPLLETLDTLFRAPLLVARVRRMEETVAVVLEEEVVFDEGVRGVKLVVEAPYVGREVGHGVGRRTVGGGAALGVYGVSVEFCARLGGVRWVMYHYRVLSFVVATALFWGVECVCMAVVWWGVYTYFSAGEVEGGRRVDEEEEDWQRRRRVDEEEEDWQRRRRMGYLTPEPTPGLEVGGAGVEEVYADDEEDENEELVGVEVGDSGLGSMSESASSTRAKAVGENGQRRRRSRSGD